MRFIRNDPDYNALLLTLNRECAAALVETSRELRLDSATLVADSRRLRLGCRQRSQTAARREPLLIRRQQ